MPDASGVSAGAEFVRADLHIHSFGETGSFDVTDTGMTPQAIVDTALAAGLRIISITDHNEIGNVKVALDYVAENDLDILVLPGIEVSTTQGHLLVYFESFKILQKFHAQLNISDDRERCNEGIVSCLDFAGTLGGFGICAHIDLSSGFEAVINRFNRVMEDIICHPVLLGLEISKKDSAKHYTAEDDNVDRKALAAKRAENLDFLGDHILPKLMSSDAHSISKLGTNASGDKRLTRFKVDSLTFEAVRIALIQHESRVRLEDFIPQRVPRFISLELQGGMLDGQVVRFSNNLNCIIGGRGTGKSTLLHALREASGNSTDANVVDSDVWPDDIKLTYEDETGGRTVFKRSIWNNARNTTDPETGIDGVNIECYGQGETMETIKHSDDDPLALLKFLDGFLDLERLNHQDEEICDKLLDNQSESKKLRISIAQIPDVKRQLADLRKKQKRLEQDEVGDLVRYQMALVKERTLRDELIKDLKKLIKNYKEALSDTSLFTDFENLCGDDIVVGKTEFQEVKRIVKEFAGIVAKQSDDLGVALQQKISELNTQITSWKTNEADIQSQIDEKKRDLEAAGIPFDMGKINQIANDIDHYEKQLKALQNDERDLKEREKVRAQLIKDRKKIKTEVFRQRTAFSIKIKDNLKNSVDGLHVSAEFKEGCYSPLFQEQLKELMGWRTSQVNKSKLIAASLSPLEFSSLVRRGDLSVLRSITDDANIKAFSDNDVAGILERAKDGRAYEDFEALAFEDRPKIHVTKFFEKEGGVKKPVTRPISKLSLGQQQSILLAILIQSNSDKPLLIDQPEDNLDSEFVYKTIVSNLRRIKETRQVIVVTHNANIAVLGDAELVIPLKSTHDKTQIMDRGSIDRTEVKDRCCEILEGGKRAFMRRQQIYNIPA